jgi:hypothetical protein
MGPMPFIPRLLPGRVKAQQARFTYHNEGQITIPDHALVRLVIPRASKRRLRAALAERGLSGYTLLANLDEIATNILTPAGYRIRRSRTARGARGIHVRGCVHCGLTSNFSFSPL